MPKDYTFATPVVDLPVTLDDEPTVVNEGWIEYDDRGRVKRRGNPERGDTAPVAWCSPHNCHPEDCFTIHYPDAHRP